MEKSQVYNREHLIHLLIVAIGFGVRFYNLGAVPLSDGEAGWALQALDVANRNAQLAPGAQAGYVALTGGLFTLLGSSNFVARLLPALAGGLIVLLPFLFRRQLGRNAAILCAIGLALDPGMVSAARMAAGPMPAAALSLLALGLALNGSTLGAGIAGGLALISGPALLPGLLAGLAAVGLYRLVPRTSQSAGADDETMETIAFSGFDLRRAALAAVVTALVCVTLFGRFPQGLGAWMGAIPAYLQGFGLPSGVPASRLGWLLVIYQPLALIFGLLGALRAWRSGGWEVRLVSLWLAASLLLALVYPDRQPADLVWVVPALWALAAYELDAHLGERGEAGWIAYALAGAVLVLMALFGQTLAGLGQVGLALEGAPLRLGVLLGTLALQAVMVLLVGLGWDWRSARWGLVAGLFVSLGLYSLAGMWGSSQYALTARQELWRQTPAAGDADLLLATLDDLSRWKTGEADAIDILAAVKSPSLHWILRDFTNVRYLPESETLSLADSPSVVISRQIDQQPELAASYRGQDFAWETYPGWEGALPPDALRWLALRQAPLLQDQVIVWARGDLFPGGAFSALPEPSEPEEMDPALQTLP